MQKAPGTSCKVYRLQLKFELKKPKAHSNNQMSCTRWAPVHDRRFTRIMRSITRKKKTHFQKCHAITG